MTELAVPDNGGEIERPAQAAPQYQASALVQWAYEAQQAHQIAISLSKTSFVPATLKGKPDDITAAILAGQELGLQPMATLRSMDVIQGTPALRAHAMRGLVQSHGHEIELVESTAEQCVMRGRRKGAEGWQTVTWDLDRARGLGLLGKNQWKAQPKTMLVARATGEICRLIASDVLHAMPYASEELGDGTVRPETGATGPRVTAAEILSDGEQAPAPSAASGPVPDAESEPYDPDAEARRQAAADSWGEPDGES